MAEKCSARLVHVHPIVVSNWIDRLDYAMRFLNDIRIAVRDGQKVDVEALVCGADALIARVESEIEERYEEFRDEQREAASQSQTGSAS